MSIRLSATYSGIELQVWKAGAPSAADATPTGILYRNGTATAQTVTIASTAQTGRYLASFETLGTGDGWSIEDHLVLRCVAVIEGDPYPTISLDSLGHPPADLATTSTVQAAGFTTDRNNALTAVAAGVAASQNLLESDEKIRPGRYQKLLPGTNTVILDKDVTIDGDDIDLVERP